MARNEGRDQLLLRVLPPLGAALLVGAAVYLAVTGGVPGLVAGLGGLAAAAVLYVGNRHPRQDAGAVRLRGDAVELPRRAAYGYLTGLGMVLGGVAITAVGAIGIEIGAGRGWAQPELMILLGPPLAVAGLLVLVGAALGRGVVRLTETELRYVRVLGRTRRAAWDAITGLDGDDTGIVVLHGGRRAVIPTASQQLTRATITGMIESMRAASSGERRAIIASGGPVAPPAES